MPVDHAPNKYTDVCWYLISLCNSICCVLPNVNDKFNLQQPVSL